MYEHVNKQIKKTRKMNAGQSITSAQNMRKGRYFSDNRSNTIQTMMHNIHGSQCYQFANNLTLNNKTRPSDGTDTKFSEDNRRTVGIGENVIIISNLKGQWKMTGGNKYRDYQFLKKIKWIAPITPGNYTITLTPNQEDEEAKSLTFTVVKPTMASELVSRDDDKFSINNPGVYMTIGFIFNPTNVYFDHLMYKEVDKGTGRCTGYFKHLKNKSGYENIDQHNPFDGFTGIRRRSNRNEATNLDNCGSCEGPLADDLAFEYGSLLWNIKLMGKSKYHSGEFALAEMKQEFRMLDNTGAMCVKKLRSHHIRKPGGTAIGDMDLLEKDRLEHLVELPGSKKISTPLIKTI